MKVQYVFEPKECNDDLYELYLVQHAKDMALLIYNMNCFFRELYNHPERKSEIVGELQNYDYVKIDKLCSWWHEKVKELSLDIDKLIV